MDLIAFVAGLIVGIVAVSIAVEFAWKKDVPEKKCKLVKKWRQHEIKNPLIVTEKLLTEPPKHAKIVVKEPSSFAKKARENTNVKGNFIVGIEKALIFAGDIRDDQLAMLTSDEDIINELHDTFYSLYKTPEKKQSKISQKGPVTIRGIVRAVFPYREGYLMRVSYEKGIIGAIMKERMDVEGRRVEIVGELLEPPFMEPYNIKVLD